MGRVLLLLAMLPSLIGCAALAPGVNTELTKGTVRDVQGFTHVIADALESNGGNALVDVEQRRFRADVMMGRWLGVDSIPASEAPSWADVTGFVLEFWEVVPPGTQGTPVLVEWFDEDFVWMDATVRLQASLLNDQLLRNVQSQPGWGD